MSHSLPQQGVWCSTSNALQIVVKVLVQSMYLVVNSLPKVCDAPHRGAVWHGSHRLCSGCSQAQVWQGEIWWGSEVVAEHKTYDLYFIFHFSWPTGGACSAEAGLPRVALRICGEADSTSLSAPWGDINLLVVLMLIMMVMDQEHY